MPTPAPADPSKSQRERTPFQPSFQQLVTTPGSPPPPTRPPAPAFPRRPQPSASPAPQATNASAAPRRSHRVKTEPTRIAPTLTGKTYDDNPSGPRRSTRTRTESTWFEPKHQGKTHDPDTKGWKARFNLSEFTPCLSTCIDPVTPLAAHFVKFFSYVGAAAVCVYKAV